jgi:hypothetical protein
MPESAAPVKADILLATLAGHWLLNITTQAINPL